MAVGVAEGEKALGGAGGVWGFGVAVFLWGGAHEDGEAFPCVLGEGVFVAVEDGGDVVWGDGFAEGGEVGWGPPFFEAPASETVVPEENDGALAGADGGFEVAPEEVEALAWIIPWGWAVVDGAVGIAWEEVELDEVEVVPVP